MWDTEIGVATLDVAHSRLRALAKRLSHSTEMVTTAYTLDASSAKHDRTIFVGARHVETMMRELKRQIFSARVTLGKFAVSFRPFFEGTPE